jgi:GNAT superfamily N-acetyltransferase
MGKGFHLLTRLSLVVSLEPMWATSAASHVMKHFRRQGALHTARVLTRRCLYGSHEFLITRARLGGPAVDDRVGDIDFRPAGKADLARLGELDHFGRRGWMARAAVEEDGDWLFIACQTDRIVAMRLVAHDVPPHGVVRKVITLSPDQVWEKELFCLPEYRGRGIARHLSLYGDRCLAAQGYTELLGIISVDNTSSLRMHVRKGVDFACYASYRRLLTYERLQISPELPKELEAHMK